MPTRNGLAASEIATSHLAVNRAAEHEGRKHQATTRSRNALTRAASLVAAAAVFAGMSAEAPVLAAPSPVATYDFDTGSGATLSDRSGNNYHGTLANGPTWTSGRYGGGLAFDGTNDYVALGDIAPTDGLTSVTVSAWVKFAVAGGGANETHLIDKSHCSGSTNGGPWELGVSLTSSRKAEFLIYPQGGSPSAYIFSGPSTTSIDDGAWHYVTGRYDGSRISIWIDGVQESSRAASGVRLSSTSYAVELGGRCNGYAYPFRGTLDDVRIYSRALTQSEIASDAATAVGGDGQSAPPPPPPPPPPQNDTTAPSTPTALSTTSVTSSQVGIAWQASTDNVGVSGYRVYRNGSLVATTSTTTHTSTGLSPNASYVFTVAAFDSAGNASAQSSPRTVTTSASSGVSYSTNFDSNENPISEGGRWRRASNLWTNVQTSGGVAFGTNGITNSYDDSYALLSGFGADQTLEAVVFRDSSLSPGPTHEVELLLRATDSPTSMRAYEILFDYTGVILIMRWNGGFGDVSWLSVHDERTLGRQLTTGDVVKATIVGSTIRVYINGQQMGWTTDSAIASGQPGIGFFIRPGGSQRLIGYTSLSVTSP
jgi:chitodextrinase